MLIRPDRKDEKPRFGSLGGVRQWIESIFDTLKGQTGLERHGARTLDGVMARVGCKLLLQPGNFGLFLAQPATGLGPSRVSGCPVEGPGITQAPPFNDV